MNANQAVEDDIIEAEAAVAAVEAAAAAEIAAGGAAVGGRAPVVAGGAVVGGRAPVVVGAGEELASDGETVRPIRNRAVTPPPPAGDVLPPRRGVNKRATRRKAPRADGVNSKYAKHSFGYTYQYKYTCKH